MGRARVILADSHTLLLEALTRLLGPVCDVVATVADGSALLVAATTLHPDVVVTELNLPVVHGLEAARQLRRLTPDVHLVFLTANESPELAVEAFAAGAMGYVLKRSEASELVKAINEAMNNHSYVTPLMAEPLAQRMVQPHAATPAPHLTPRERDVLQLLVQGRRMKDIAGVLHIAPRTVAYHKYRIMSHLGIKTTAQLIKYAIVRGVV